MKRKIVQQGPTTLLVSLPHKWVKAYGVKKGNEIDVNERGDSLIINIEGKEDDTSIDLNISGLDRTSIMHTIRSCYRQGYAQMNIRFSNRRAIHFRTGEEEDIAAIVRNEVEKLIGLEITDQKQNFIVVRDYSTSSLKDFDNSLRRIFLLTVDMSRDFIKAIETCDSELMDSIVDKHNNITKFISYCLRLLGKRGYSDIGRTMILYHIIDGIDMMIDIFKYASKDISGQKIRPEAKNIIKDINQSIEWFYELFYKYDNKTVVLLNKNRDDIKKQIRQCMGKLPESEIVLIVNMEHILEIIWDLVLAEMGMYPRDNPKQS